MRRARRRHRQHETLAHQRTVFQFARHGAGDTAGGSIVFTSSGSVLFGQQKGQHYASSKGAVIAMAKGIAVEHARYGVRANAVLPGWIATDMTAGAQDSDVFNSKVISRVPMRRWGEPEDFGGIAATGGCEPGIVMPCGMACTCLADAAGARQ